MTAKDPQQEGSVEQKLIRETGLSEIEIEKSGLKVRVARTLRTVDAAVVARHDAALAPPAGHAAPAPATAAPADLSKHPGAVKSPMVGTAYRAPEPGAR